MEQEYLSKEVKLFNTSINASILFVILLWVSFGLLSLFPNETSDQIASYLLIISIFPLISGLIIVLVYAFSNDPILIVSDQVEIKLILNLSEYDYRMDQLWLLKSTGSFLVDPISNTMYELTSVQVQELLSMNREAPFVLEFQKHKSSLLAAVPPKTFLIDIIKMVFMVFT